MTEIFVTPHDTPLTKHSSPNFKQYTSTNPLDSRIYRSVNNEISTRLALRLQPQTTTRILSSECLRYTNTIVNNEMPFVIIIVINRWTTNENDFRNNDGAGRPCFLMIMSRVSTHIYYLVSTTRRYHG